MYFIVRYFYYFILSCYLSCRHITYKEFRLCNNVEQLYICILYYDEYYKYIFLSLDLEPLYLHNIFLLLKLWTKI